MNKLKVRSIQELFHKSFNILKNKRIKEFAKNFYFHAKYGRKYFSKRENYKELEKNMVNKNFEKFKFIDSSITWYGITKQLERNLINLGYEPSETGVSICYANDIGEVDPYSLKKINQENRVTLRRALDSKADFLFYSQKICDKWFKDRRNSFYLPSGVDTNVFKLYDGIVRDVNVGFVGKRYDTPVRKEFLNKLSSDENNFNFVMAEKDNLFFENLARFYNRCKIVVNDSQQNEITMRMFEATACGCLLITRKVPFIDELFEPGKEIVTYNNNEDMIKKIKHYLKNEKERIRITENGRKKTHLVHSYYDRARFIVNKIKGERKASFITNEEKYIALYDNLHNALPKAQERLFDPSLPDTNVKWNIRERMRKTVALCRGDVLDVGTQKGGYLLHARKNPEVKRLVGIDISKDYIIEAKKRQPDVEFKVGRIEKIPFPNESFDTIMVTEVLEHIPNLMKGIYECKRVMKKDGQLLISVPDYDYEEDPYHVRNFTRFDFTQLFENMKVKFIDLKDCLNILVRITNR
ncbi:MAG: glycosyltransferase [Candidatus Moranbacteria bacterium]|nr:glycosyltransferase [Candidatus Moranbacteria bacterium]